MHYQFWNQRSMQFQLWIVDLHILRSVGTDTLDWQSDSIRGRICLHENRVGGNFVKIKFHNRISRRTSQYGQDHFPPLLSVSAFSRRQNRKSKIIFQTNLSPLLFFRPDFGQIYFNELIVSQTPPLHYLCEYSKRRLQKQMFNICSKISTFLNEFPGITISKLKVFSKVKDKWNEFSENPLTRNKGISALNIGSRLSILRWW